MARLADGVRNTWPSWRLTWKTWIISPLWKKSETGKAFIFLGEDRVMGQRYGRGGKFRSSFDVLHDSINEQIGRFEAGEIDRESLLDEFAFLSQFHHASIYIRESRDRQLLCYDRAVLAVRPHVTVVGVDAA
jgi:hypothetical protein